MTCKRGHDGPRRANRTCVECERLKNAAYRAAHPERDRNGNPERAAARKAAYAARHPERVSDTQRRHRDANPERVLSRIEAWRAAHPEQYRAQVNANTARRRALLLGAMCDCCTSADIRAVYDACPDGHETDHITALWRGGKHCRHNLQALTIPAHAAKTAKEARERAKVRRSSYSSAGIGR